MASTKLQPVGGKVLIEPTEAEETTASGIVIAPTANKEKPQRGKVIKLGTGGIDKNGNKIVFSVKEGDEVFFTKYSPEEIELDGKKYLVLEESAILAIVSK